MPISAPALLPACQFRDRTPAMVACAARTASHLCVSAALLVIGSFVESAPADELSQGREIFLNKCAMCHGPGGEGVADKYDEMLHGQRSLAELIKVIEETMPQENAEECIGDDARKVGQYIYQTFYTAAARAKHRPPRIELSRLTVPQYENAIADLAGSFIGRREISDQRGLDAEYFDDRRHNDRKLQRIDKRVDFQFGEKSPDEKIRDKEFSMRWQGSILIEETGEYEFGVKTENGFQLWINGRDPPLVDGYVAAGPEPVRRDEAIRLLGGRTYPLRLEWFKYKDKTASVQLMWKPPHKVWEVIPQRHLSPNTSLPSLIITTPLPADDGSLGYPRGTDVSQAWDEATTYAAVEVANRAVKHLDALAKVRSDTPDRRQKLEEFCASFAERAFRRPLNDAQRQAYVATHFADTANEDEASLKRSTLMTLKSPYFLYVNLPGENEQRDSFTIASRLSFALWDSIPDEPLRRAAGRNQLQSREQILSQARRMAADPRAKAKLRRFFEHWLQLNDTEHLAKDAETFAGFDEQLTADLRTSLELFISDFLESDAADYRQLLLAEDWYVNERLAKYYHIDVPADAVRNGAFTKSKSGEAKRAGVVTHPYILASLSYHNSTSPIHRGVFASRRLLGRPLNPPPNAILFEDAKFDPHLTMREKVTELTKATSCQSCHSIINPLGFSLENFDAVGRYRTTEKDKPIDPVSDFQTAGGQTLRLTSGRDLAEYAAGSEAAQRAFIEQLFHHTVKQPAAAFGENTLSDLHRSFVDSQYNVRQLLIEIAVISADR